MDSNRIDFREWVTLGREIDSGIFGDSTEKAEEVMTAMAFQQGLDVGGHEDWESLGLVIVESLQSTDPFVFRGFSHYEDKGRRVDTMLAARSMHSDYQVMVSAARLVGLEHCFNRSAAAGGRALDAKVAAMHPHVSRPAYDPAAYARMGSKIDSETALSESMRRSYLLTMTYGITAAGLTEPASKMEKWQDIGGLIDAWRNCSYIRTKPLPKPTFKEDTRTRKIER